MYLRTNMGNFPAFYLASYSVPYFKGHLEDLLPQVLVLPVVDERQADPAGEHLPEGQRRRQGLEREAELPGHGGEDPRADRVEELPHEDDSHHGPDFHEGPLKSKEKLVEIP